MLQSTSLLNSLYQLVRPFGLKKMGGLFVLVGFQSILQILAFVILGLFMQGILQPAELNNGVVAGVLAQLGITNLTVLNISVACIISQVLLGASGLIYEKQRCKVGAQFNAWLKLWIFNLLEKLPYSYYLQIQPSHLNKIITQDTQITSEMVFSMSLDVFSKLLVAISLVIMLLVQNPVICLLLFSIIVGAYALLIIIFKSKRKDINYYVKQSNSGVNQVALQFISGIKVVKSANKQSVFRDKFSESAHSLAKFSNLGGYLGIAPRYIIETIGICALVGAYLFMTLVQGNDSQTALVQFSAMGYAAIKLLVLFQGIYQGLNSMLTNKSYMNEVLNFIKKSQKKLQKIEKDKSTNILEPVELKFSELSFKEVNFSYENQSKTALLGVNLIIKKGDRLGIVGKTGSGKSTIIDLMLGLIEPSAGEVQINGHNLHGQAGLLQAWQAKVGYVPQDIFLLDESIAKNIALELDESKIDINQVKQVCKMAQIDAWIESDLEQGYNTLVGDRGVRLSGGQRQRIAIARALYCKPEVLILDEATSALDNQTESDLMEMIYELDKGITIIMIAHRLSTVSKVDKVIELRNGNLCC